MSERAVALVGVPLDLGAGRRGVDMGPSAFRVAEIERKIRDLGYRVDDAGDLPVPIPETQSPGDPRAKYLKEIQEVCATLPATLRRLLGEGKRPVILGGEHYSAVGTLAGLP